MANKYINPTPKPCHQCGAETLKPMYCSSACKGKAHRERNPDKLAQYRETQRLRLKARPRLIRHCVKCSVQLEGRSLLHCAKCQHEADKACQRRSYYRSRGDVRCPDCDRPIANDGSYQHRCEACRLAALRSQRRASKARRRAMERTVNAETFDPLEVLARDGWRCHICGVRTPKRLRGTYADNAPELDHIVPLSAGGQHTRLNTACACRRCNIAKGGTVKGQLRLVA